MEARDGDQNSNKNKKNQNGPSVDPDLRKSSTKPEIGGDFRHRVCCRSLYVLRGVIVSHPMIASGKRWRQDGEGRLLVGHSNGDVYVLKV